MASTITTTITARIPNEEAAAFREQARRHGLAPSQAACALIRGAVYYEQQRIGERREGDRA